MYNYSWAENSPRRPYCHKVAAYSNSPQAKRLALLVDLIMICALIHCCLARGELKLHKFTNVKIARYEERKMLYHISEETEEDMAYGIFIARRL